MDLLHLLEPEETIGNLWHRLVGGGSTLNHYPEAAARFDEVAPRLRVFFRGLGGDPGAEIKAASPEVSRHRLTRVRRLGARAEKIARARFNGDRLNLPGTIDVYPERALNERAYFWLTAWAAVAGTPPEPDPAGPMSADVCRIAHAAHTTHAVLELFPGLIKDYRRLSAATLQLRPKRVLPEAEAAVEAEILRVLGIEDPRAREGRDAAESVARPKVLATPKDYRPYLPVPIWVEIEARPAREPARQGDEEPGSGSGSTDNGRSRKARRRASDQIGRRGGLFVHRFEKILTWTEFMNLHRNVEDDDEESARKAAGDHDDIGVARLEKRAATRLAFDLDMAPSDADEAGITGRHTYPEWDYARQAYHEHHVRVLERVGHACATADPPAPDEARERRIRAVRRQFEGLRPRREILGRQFDGQELDMDALTRSVVDLKARGEGSDRVFRQTRNLARDLSVAVLVDVSRSTESFVGDRSVLDVEREALIALAEGLEACGDEAAILAFSSLRRDRVFVSRLKDFGERSGPLLRQRVAALKPGFYTRLGGAIRHASAVLAGRPSKKRLLLVLTDGKPNDLDHYEGRYGIEDSRRAIGEARRSGHCVFGITVDSKAQSYFPHIFGAGGFAILSHPSRLTAALPVLYRHLVA